MPPKGWTNAARARRASRPHSGPSISCSMRNGGSAGPRTGGKAQCQATVSPSGRVREPATTSEIGEPAPRRAVTSRRAPSVASAYVTSPGAPASRARTDRRADRMGQGQRTVPDPDQLQVRVPEEDEPVAGPHVVPSTARGGQPELGFQQRCRRVRVVDGDDKVVDAEEHPRRVRAARRPPLGAVAPGPRPMRGPGPHAARIARFRYPARHARLGRLLGRHRHGRLRGRHDRHPLSRDPPRPDPRRARHVRARRRLVPLGRRAAGRRPRLRPGQGLRRGRPERVQPDRRHPGRRVRRRPLDHPARSPRSAGGGPAIGDSSPSTTA